MIAMGVVKINERGILTIDQAILQMVDLKTDDHVLVSIENDMLTLVKQK